MTRILNSAFKLSPERLFFSLWVLMVKWLLVLWGFSGFSGFLMVLMVWNVIRGRQLIRGLRQWAPHSVCTPERSADNPKLSVSMCTVNHVFVWDDTDVSRLRLWMSYVDYYRPLKQYQTGLNRHTSPATLTYSNKCAQLPSFTSKQKKTSPLSSLFLNPTQKQTHAWIYPFTNTERSLPRAIIIVCMTF